MKITLTIDPSAPNSLVSLVREDAGKTTRLATVIGKGNKSLRAYLIGLIRARISNAPADVPSFVVAEGTADDWMATLANAFQGQAPPAWRPSLADFLGGDILTATRKHDSTPARVHFHAVKCRGWEWVFFRKGGSRPLTAAALEQLAFDLEQHGGWKPHLLSSPSLSTSTASGDEEDAGKDRWTNEVRRRIGKHRFDQSPEPGTSPLMRLLNSVHRLHFLDKRFSTVQPPLPYLPALPLDERWVELRISDGRLNTPYFRGSGFAEMASHVSVARLLSLADSALVTGAPGAGKSTMMKWAARHLISETKNQSLIPLFVPLRTYARWRERHPDGSIVGYLAEFHRLPVNEFADFVADVEIGRDGLKGLCKFLLDGWDEVPECMRADVSEDIYAIQHLIPVLITSRPSGYVGSLHFDTRYDIAPLSYECMRLLMREWLSMDGKPQLESLLCEHLDRHLAFRELARNPFVLTLLCAIASKDWPSPIPTRKSALYSRLIEITRQTCTAMFRHEGYAWTKNDANKATAAAFKTLQGPSGGCGYEFDLAELTSAAGDEGRTAKLLDQSRLITLAYEEADQWSFVHPTVHEFMAAQHLAHSPEGAAPIATYALNSSWLRVMVFVCGLLEVEPRSSAWQKLRNAASQPDRFGMVALRLAAILSEVSCQDGGEKLVGADVRPILWDCFMKSPKPGSYAMALVELDPEYVMGRIDSIPENATGMRAVMMLYNLLPPEMECRAKLQHALMNISGKIGRIPWDEVEYVDLPPSMGFHPLRSPNLSYAVDLFTYGDATAKLEEDPPPSIRRSLRIRLGALGGSMAEELLTKSFVQATDPVDEIELVEALATLGTVGARDALMAKLKQRMEPETGTAAFLAEQILNGLRGLPLHGADAKFVLMVARSKAVLPIRVAAAAALSNCQDDRTLSTFSGLMSLNESEMEMRIRVMETLTANQAMYGLRGLLAEGIAGRPEEERRSAWNYVISCAACAGSGPLAQASSVVEMAVPAIAKFLAQPTSDPVHPDVARHCRKLSGETVIAAVLLDVACSHEFSIASRAAACEALAEMETPEGAEERILRLLDEADSNPDMSILTRAAALALAAINPHELLPRARRQPVCLEALWSAALDQGLLVYEDRITTF